MKVQIILLAVIVGILATGTAYAAKNEGDGDPQRNRFERLDADGNGRIDRDEFAKVGDFRFGKLDANGDGAITLAELEDRDRSERLTRRFEHMDADDNGEVTRSEFTAAGDRMFQHLDENGDGFLSMGELERRRHGGGNGGKPAN
jgi:hypothetical protein